MAPARAEACGGRAIILDSPADDYGRRFVKVRSTLAKSAGNP
jgi:hypothetical protein